MKVRVQVFGEEPKDMEITEGAKVLDLLRGLGINRETVLVKLNGKIVPEEEELKEGAEVKIFKVVTGG
jgi:thiamine biosynthesis protein ThiS